MATIKRSDSKSLKEAPPRSCMACTETELPLVRPCRYCDSDYCIDCLIDMFTTPDQTRMPPHCCALIQIHTILGHLTHDQAKAYRARFEEWIAPVKTYCPAPTCSAFISEQRLPAIPPSTKTPSLSTVLTDVLRKVIDSTPARFFRGDMDITQLPGYTTVITHPIDLNMIQGNIDRYKTTNDLTLDMKLVLDNARSYNGSQHPVSKAAEELFAKFIKEVSNVTDRLVSTSSASSLFACPRCHIAICSTCKQVEHTGQPCDSSAQDHEIAMLHTFGYKRCPRCKAAVKKMWGCNHMQCLCGAHWCYYCQRGLDECDGACGEREDESDDEEAGYDSDEEALEAREHREDREIRKVDAGGRAVPQSAAPGSGTRPDNRIVNLDAGGGNRWANGEHDFGEEPEDEPFVQVWSCSHKFEAYKATTDDGFDHGDLDRMECNRCFEKVDTMRHLPTPKPPDPKKRHRTGRTSKSVMSTVETQISIHPAEKNEAWECTRCRVLCCVTCRDRSDKQKRD